MIKLVLSNGYFRKLEYICVQFQNTLLRDWLRPYEHLNEFKQLLSGGACHDVS